VQSKGARPPQENTETAILEAQLETIKDYDQRLQNTIQWAISIVAASLAVLAGFNWYTNRKEFARERAALKADLHKSLDDFGRSVDQLEEKLRSAMKAELAESEKKLRDAAAATIKSLSERVNTKFLQQEIEANLREADDWEKREILSNSILMRRMALEKLISAGSERQILDQLVKLKELLKKIPPQLLHPSHAIDLPKVLEKLPKEFDVEKASLLELLRNLRK
jgi:alkanesulfonate monooxygenase SsuD/methylene tetrahydromethanopterin reductase-like flavin-dependent oxidoreductase (luciferase family)